jgi:predicted O-linked N-acetylglucosamine transferase (SPINDLY family)
VARGHVTFGCFNSLGKVHDTMLARWAEILRAVPGSRLRIKGAGLGGGPVRTALLERMERAGVAVAQVDLLERTAGTAEHLAAYGDVDIALDTFPYHGTTTTCESLWMGVPVVSLIGDRHMSRVGHSLLSAAGHPEWTASSPADYVRRAVELAADPQRLAVIRRGLRADLARGPLLDHAGQAERFGAALRQCWTAWCERTAAPVEAALA